jgi:hypothetical protein
MPSKTPPTKTNQTNQSPLNTYKNQPKNGVYMHFSTKKKRPQQTQTKKTKRNPFMFTNNQKSRNGHYVKEKGSLSKE